MPPDDPLAPLTMVDPDGVAHDVPRDQVPAALQLGFKAEGAEARAGRVTEGNKEAYYSTPGAKLNAGLAAVGRGATLGLSDAVATAVGGEDTARDLRELKERQSGISTVGEIGGAVLTAIPSGGESLLGRLPGGAVAKLGARIAETGEGASAATKIGRAALGGSAEGALYGIGSGVSELSLSEDPVTIERAASVLSSNALYGGLIGAGAGTVAKSLELGLGKAKGAIDSAMESRAAQDAVPADLAALDAKGLRAAEGTEVEAIKAAKQTETEAIETSRVTQRKEVADDIAKFRREIDDSNQWATTKDLKLAAEDGKLSAAKLGRDAVKANRQLEAVLGNPKGLAENPGKALDALQRQEQSLMRVAERADDLKLAYAADDLGGRRLAALDQVPALLERNRGLQAKLAELKAPLKLTTPDVSERLAAIRDAKDAFATAAAQPKSFAEQALGSAVFGGVMHASGTLLPGIGHFVGAAAGAKVSKAVTDLVFGRMTKATSEVAARSSRAVSAFLDTATKVAKVAPPVATKVLQSVAFAPAAPAASRRSNAHEPVEPKGQTALAKSYMARAAEIRSQTVFDLTGKSVMRPEARQAMADRLAGIRAAQPVLADKIETLGAAKLEFLASKLPRRPDLAGMPTGGPDRWQPSDLAMRAFARYVAAVEDPGAVEERLAHGTVTPEDAEAMRAVYPERMAAITQEIIAKLPTLRKALPYHRRLALSIFSGVPVDPAMDPMILKTLQATFVDEDGTQGGTEAPKPAPQFGSVKAEKPTPSQSRSSMETSA